MEIEIVKEARRQSESEIRAIINMFENQTGCPIYGIDIIRIDTASFAQSYGAKSKIIRIALDVRIED